MANKLYQKQGGQLVEVPLGGSSQDLSQYVTSSAILPIVSSGGYVTSSYVAGATVSSAGIATKLGTTTVGGANNPVYISSGKATAGNTFVPNSGGTFSGDLHVTSKFFVDAGYIYASDPSFSKGITPSGSENYIFQLLATDAAGDSSKYRLGAYQVYVTTSGTVCNEISTYPNISGNSNTGARLSVWQPLSGSGSVTIASARPPEDDDSSKVPDTHWVRRATVASAGSAGTITSTLPISKGGTGRTEFTNTNGVLTVAAATSLGAIATANGAFYATSANGHAQFGTLPVAQGGTGATTLASAGIATKVATKTATYASTGTLKAYEEINNGGTKFQIEYGRTSVNSAGATITFSRNFGAAPFVIASPAPSSTPTGSGNNLSVLTGPSTASNFTALVRDTTGKAITAYINYIAIGTGA